MRPLGALKEISPSRIRENGADVRHFRVFRRFTIIFRVHNLTVNSCQKNVSAIPRSCAAHRVKLVMGQDVPADHLEHRCRNAG